MSKLDFVCVGHLVYDIRDYVEEFPQEDKTVFLRRPPAMSAGGSAANFALNCSKLGHSAGLVSTIGEDAHGKFLLDELKREKIDRKEVKIVKGGRTGLSIILIDKSGQVQVIEDVGSVDEPRKMPQKYISSAKWVHLSGCSHSWLEQASAMAHKKGVPLSFDPGRAASRLGAEKLSTILERVELLLLNKKELMALTGSSSHLEVKNISREFNCSVVLKTGHGPAIVCHDGHALFEVPPFDAPEVVDTLGAGDAFGAGVICGKMEGKALYEAVRMGHACAAAKVMHAGAQSMPKKETIRKLFKF